MKPALEEVLPEYVLAILPDAEAAQIEALLAADPGAARAADELTAALTLLAARLPPVPPHPATRARLMTTLASADRFAPFLAPLARILQLSRDKVRAVLARLDDAASWDKGLPGIEILHFDAGPALAGADAGIIRFQPGVVFPRHRHLVGRETTFVLEGAMLDGDRVYGPGSIVEHDKDTVHFCGATQDRALLMMVIHYGIEPVFG